MPGLLLPGFPMPRSRSRRSDHRTRLDGLGDPCVSADNTAGTDDDIAENRGFGVDGDIVFDRRVALAALDDPPALIARKTHRSQRHALVDLHAVADNGRFTDDYAGAVIDEKVLADRRAGVNIDSGFRMGRLAHDPRDQRDIRPVQFIGDPVRADRLDARIGNDDLLETLGGRIAVVGGLNVALEQFADYRQ